MFEANVLNSAESVLGYYVKCRGHHYILQEYNNNGYDERWEASEWIEIDVTTLKYKGSAKLAQPDQLTEANRKARV